MFEGQDFSKRKIVEATLYEGTVQPLDVVAVGVDDEHFVGDDGDGQEEDGADGDGQRERAQPGADAVDCDLVLVGAVVVFAALPLEATQQGKTQQVEE